MRHKKNNIKLFAVVASLVFAVLMGSLIVSCSSKNTAISEEKSNADHEHQSEQLKKISGIFIDESGYNVKIQSDERLTYSFKKIENSNGVEVCLPKTFISGDVVKEIKSGGLISSVKSEKRDDNLSVVLITALSEFDYAVARESDTLVNISLKKRNISAELNKSKISLATQLVSIKTEDRDNGLIVNLIGNGRISNYKKSVIEKPNPRIVFDIYNIKSDAVREKKIHLKSDFAENIRYYNYTDYVRVVIDTKSDYLKKFSDSPLSDGLLINIGETGVGASSAASSATQTATNNKIDKIDLSTDDSGKSILNITTSSQVKYDIIPVSDKKIDISIKDTFLSPPWHKPVISSRYESAVEKVIPSQNNADSSFSVEMKEQVPYRVDQKGKIISVYFDKGISSAASGKSGLKVSSKSSSIPISSKSPLKISERVILASKNLSYENEDGSFDIGNTKKTYIGEKIALDFFETDIRNVFRIIQTVSKKNFAIDTDVKGKVTMRMDEPVPWDQVLDLVLKMNSLGMVHEGEIIRIATLERLKREEDMKKEVLKAKRDKESQEIALEPLYTEYITVNYSNAKSEVLPHLRSVITEKRGTVSIDDRNNQVIITDTREKIAKAREIIKSIDKVTPQVIIEARIVEATNSVSREVGTSWSAIDSSVGSASDDTVFGWQAGAVNLPGNTAGSVGINFTKIAGNSMLLSAKLEAFESTGDIKIISSPKVLTLDNKEAKIEQGVEYPYLKEIDEDGEATYELKPLTLTLTVKPHVTPDNRVAMTINIKKDDIGDEIVQSQTGLTGQTKTFARVFLKKEATTELLVDDGETVVIGGIVKTRSEDSSQGVPYLSKIPVLGWLFKNKIMDNERSELLLFITPRIVQLEQKG